jgi:hypothetical protein
MVPVVAALPRRIIDQAPQRSNPRSRGAVPSPARHRRGRSRRRGWGNRLCDSRSRGLARGGVSRPKRRAQSSYSPVLHQPAPPPPAQQPPLGVGVGVCVWQDPRGVAARAARLGAGRPAGRGVGYRARGQVFGGAGLAEGHIAGEKEHVGEEEEMGGRNIGGGGVWDRWRSSEDGVG